MWNALKLTGYVLVAVCGFCLVVGIGAATAALAALLGTALLGGAVLLVIILMVKELIDKED